MVSMVKIPVLKAPMCKCGAEMEIIGSDMVECDVDSAWHTVTCHCPNCNLMAQFTEVFHNPTYENPQYYIGGEWSE